VAKGYYREDFVQSWECHLPPCSAVAAESGNYSAPDPASSVVAPKSGNHHLATQPRGTAAPGCDDIPAELWNHPIPDPACSAVAGKCANHGAPSE
jgi:hypothetical protein